MGLTTNITRIISANFFFVDIVGLSDPSMSTKTQVKKIEVLNNCISDSEIYQSTQKDTLLTLPTGDGMCLGFLQGPELPLHLAIELQQKLAEYNKGKIPSETVRIRIGLHSGNCFIVKDIKGNDNIWGPGVILARRIMDIGNDQHILISTRMAEGLRELSDEYRRIIKPLHEYTIKHGQTILVYSAYGENFGNKEIPLTVKEEKSKFGKDALKMEKTTTYPFLEVDLTVLDPKKMLVQHKRTYEIRNISTEPIKYVTHGIATDVEKHSLADLQVQVFDEHGEMKISNINVNKPTSKEFATEFNKKILKGEKNRRYTLIYEVEEPQRYFENAFLTDVDNFSLNFKYPANGCDCKPIIYDINQETEKKTKSKIQPKIEKDGNNFIARYSRHENSKGETIRIEW